MSTKSITQTAEIIQDNQDYTLFSWSKQKGSNPIAVKYAEGVYLYDYDDKTLLGYIPKEENRVLNMYISKYYITLSTTTRCLGRMYIYI